MDYDPYPASHFDDWAASYDETVAAEPRFPFDGYRRALETVLAQAQPEPGMSVLDLGVGTGNLSLLFVRTGCKLWCSDFSTEMLARAQVKLPGAHFIQVDLRAAWPAELEQRFDRIVSAYVFHHFPLELKVKLLAEMAAKRLAPDGRIVIADISFRHAAAREAVKEAVGEEWEEEEYWLADEALQALRQAGLQTVYTQVSSCAGVYCIKGRTLF
jgi:putative AdoMet-dependent methyltransferase